MCLAVPGRILSTEEGDWSRRGRVQFGELVREVLLDFVPEAGVGDYVMVHVGFAISRVDADEAEHTLGLLKEIGLLEGEAPSANDDGRAPTGHRGQ
jgi:hydrogenase expression/formation protein HypC